MSVDNELGERSSPLSASRRLESSSRCSSVRTPTRHALIARLHVRDDAAWLAELLMDLEDEVGEIARLRLVDEIRRTLASR